MKNYFSKILILLSVVFITASISFFVYFVKKINTTVSNINVAEEKWYNEKQRRSELKILDRSVQAFENEIREIETHFAHSSDIVPFLNTVEGLGRSAGASSKVTSVKVSEDKASLVVGIKTEATWSSLYRFLSLLENSTYELEFVSLNLHKTKSLDEGVEDTEWEGSFTIKLLSFVN